MNCLKINDIKIVFDESKNKEALELRQIIKNNKLLFLEILGNIKTYSFIKDVPNAEYIDNLDEFIKQIVDVNFYSEELKKRFSDPKQILMVYLGYLMVESLTVDKIKDLYSTDTGLEEARSTLGESLHQKEIYEDILIKDYFDEQGTKEDFIEYIKTKHNKKELLEKVKDKYRFSAYNFVLENIVEYLRECGYLEPENMLEICGNIHFKMRELTFDKFIDENELNERLATLPKMNKVKLDKYFREFLNEINPEGILLKIYNDALKNKKIKISKKYNTSCFLIENDKASIEMKETGTIEDFFTLSHEFIHYAMHICNKGNIPYSLEEFPSIFFEKYSIDFLRKKGYSKEQLEVLHDFRLNDMKEKCFGILNFLIADIIDKSRGNTVDDKRLRLYVKTLNTIIEKRIEEIRNTYGTKEDGSDYLSLVDEEEYIKEDIDARTKSYFVGLIQYIEAFRYPISAYVAFNVYENLKNNKEILERVINYILFSNTTTFKDTINLFDLTEDYQKIIDDIEIERQKVLNKNNN